MSEDSCRLYLISPARIASVSDFAVLLDKALSAGDVACFQLRLKSVSKAEIVAAAEKLLPICIKNDVAFLLNDDPELAKEIGADGVHLGQHDMPIAQARTILGHDAIIGVTCHDSKHLAFEAGEAGADYVAFGAFFDSQTKTSDFRPELSLLTDWDAATEIPAVAIGGITVENCASVRAAGAHFVAVSGGVWSHSEGPEAAVQAFTSLLSVQV